MLLFVLENWVVTPRMGKALGEFQAQVTRQLTGRLLQKTLERKCKYTSAATVRWEAGFLTMEE